MAARNDGVQGPGEKRKNIATDITENENINLDR